MKTRALSTRQRVGLVLTVLLAALLLVPPGGLVLHAQRPGNTDLAYSNTADVTVTNSSTAVLASDGAPREATILVPPGADTGVRVAFGASASSASPLISPGQTLTVSTKQAINAIRAGSSSVTISLIWGR